MLQGVPWSMHLNFIDEWFVKSVEKERFRSLTPYGHHAVETLGVMDLPTFVIGRRPLTRGVWQRYRRCQPERKGGIEPVSGLPRSLLDLFSRVEEPDIEIDLQLWPGEAGDYLQCQLWEAYRLAGVLMAKRLRRSEPYPSTPDSPPGSDAPDPSAHAYALRLFSALESVWLGFTQEHRDTGDSLVMNAFMYPAFVGGLEVEFLRLNPYWEDKLQQYFQDIQERYHDYSSKNAWQFLQDFSATYEQDREFRNMSSSKGLEISLI